MSSISLKLPEELKQKATVAARQKGLSLHAFMIEAIEQAIRSAEMRAQFIADATMTRSETLQNGQAHSPAAAHAYLRKRLTNPKTQRPEGESWPGSTTPGKR